MIYYFVNKFSSTRNIKNCRIPNMKFYRFKTSLFVTKDEYAFENGNFSYCGTVGHNYKCDTRLSE